MRVPQAVHSFIEYQKVNSKANTVRNYQRFSVKGNGLRSEEIFNQI